MNEIDLRTRIREVPDFPTPGVDFKDITPLLADPAALAQTINQLAEWVGQLTPNWWWGRSAWLHPRRRGGRTGRLWLRARAQAGKLPPETLSATYALEYGRNALELHPDLIPIGARVVIHDDVLATGVPSTRCAG